LNIDADQSSDNLTLALDAANLLIVRGAEFNLGLAIGKAFYFVHGIFLSFFRSASFD